MRNDKARNAKEVFPGTTQLRCNDCHNAHNNPHRNYFSKVEKEEKEILNIFSVTQKCGSI